MVTTIIFIIIVISVISVNILKRQEDEEYDERMEQEERNSAPDTFGLMFNTLSQLGCQPEAYQDGKLSVKFQGENFYMEFGGAYARVWDPFWAGVKADDPDLPKIREAVNTANFNFGPTVVLTDPDDNGIIGFHSRWDIMLHPSYPENVEYVANVLNSFFVAKERVRSCFQQINGIQQEAQKHHRPVGFVTDDQDNSEE